MKYTKTVAVSAILSASLMALSACGTTKTLKGFDIDLAKKVGDELGVKVAFQEIVWEQKEIELSSKNIDLIWNGFTITEERQQALSFSIPYMVNKQVVVGKNSQTALSGSTAYKVAVEAGSAGSDAFDGDLLFKASQKIEVTSQIDALTEVLSGTSDLAIIDGVMAGYYLADSTSYGKSLKQLSDYENSSEYYGIGARKGEDALVAKINGALQSLYQTETTMAIASAYGLSAALVAPEAFTSYDSLSDHSSWDYIVSKGTLTIGYTVFAPIAYMA